MTDIRLLVKHDPFHDIDLAIVVDAKTFFRDLLPHRQHVGQYLFVVHELS